MDRSVIKPGMQLITHVYNFFPYFCTVITELQLFPYFCTVIRESADIFLW